MWLTGTGSDVMNCSSAPMVNGRFQSFFARLVYPATSELRRQKGLPKPVTLDEGIGYALRLGLRMRLADTLILSTIDSAALCSDNVVFSAL
jgi:hypothetical protein